MEASLLQTSLLSFKSTVFALHGSYLLPSAIISRKGMIRLAGLGVFQVYSECAVVVHVHKLSSCSAAMVIALRLVPASTGFCLTDFSQRVYF